jgi:hypothetical protein
LIKGIHNFSDMVNGPEGPAIMEEKGNEIRTLIHKKDAEYFFNQTPFHGQEGEQS